MRTDRPRPQKMKKLGTTAETNFKRKISREQEKKQRKEKKRTTTTSCKEKLLRRMNCIVVLVVATMVQRCAGRTRIYIYIYIYEITLGTCRGKVEENFTQG